MPRGPTVRGVVCGGLRPSGACGLVEEDRHRRTGQLGVALNDDDIAGIDRLLLLVEIDELVRVDRDRVPRIAAGQNRRPAALFGRGPSGLRHRDGEDDREGETASPPPAKHVGRIHGLFPVRAASLLSSAGRIFVLMRPSKINCSPLLMAVALSARIVVSSPIRTSTGSSER